MDQRFGRYDRFKFKVPCALPGSNPCFEPTSFESISFEPTSFESISSESTSYESIQSACAMTWRYPPGSIRIMRRVDSTWCAELNASFLETRTYPRFVLARVHHSFMYSTIHSRIDCKGSISYRSDRYENVECYRYEWKANRWVRNHAR